jgi:hypothetical protein
MKRIRIVLSITAFMLAIGGSITTNALFVTEPGYEFIAATGEEDAKCQLVANICDQSGMYPCKVNSAPTTPRLHRFDTSTSCGIELNRIDAPPAP